MLAEEPEMPIYLIFAVEMVVMVLSSDSMTRLFFPMPLNMPVNVFAA